MAGFNTYLKNNNIITGTQIPTEGNFKTGDIIVNIGPNSASEPMWICNEGGNPGVWGPVGVGGGSIVSINSSVLINEPVSEVSLASLGVGVSKKDKLLVHYNSTHLLEGVHFEINEDGSKIVKLGGGNWNPDGLANCIFAFELFKGVESIDGDKIVVDSKMTSITNHVVIENACSEVEIGIEGFNAGNDMMLVFKNGVNMVEGVDYEVQDGKIVSTGEVWNENGIEDYGMTFVVFKEVVEYNGDAEVKAENIADGSIGMDKLGEDVREAIEDASNIDLSGYASKEEVNSKVAQDEYDSKIAELEGRVEEAFTSANNGKQLIANAIGNELITVNSTFSAMSEAILGLRRESENETDAREVLYNMMVEDGYDSATSSMTVDELIDLLDDSQIEIGDIKQIACGDRHTFILKNDGSVWSCGLNDNYGQLGLGNTTNKTTFTQVTTNINNDVKQIACGYYHTVILKNDGSVWSCGLNDKGQLGLGTSDSNAHSTFTQVTTNINNDVAQIACGHAYTFILKNDGSIWSCGYNNYGQLGLNSVTDKSTFTQVNTNVNNDVKQIACGYYHTFILKNDGSVWSCGGYEYGQLGLGGVADTRAHSTFTQVTTNVNNDVNQIACGFNHTFILKNDGSVWGCGNNANGQLGINNTTNKTTFTQVTTNINNDVNQIACGGYHTFILKNDGSVYSCGSNSNGQLGLGDSTNRTTFTKVTTNINNDVNQIACGTNHTFILKNDSSVYSCGYNGSGQLGLNSTTTYKTFTNTNFYIPISEYEINRQKLYYYLLDNEIQVTEDMDIGTMLDLLVDDYINNMILGYENNLRIILTGEGVSVSDEDNMDSLITKVDEEFNRQVVPAGDAVASNVLSGKTFINSTGNTVTGTMTDRGGAQTVTPGTSNKTLNSGYYSGNITIQGDANLVAENIVSGKSIFGVSGTAPASVYYSSYFDLQTITCTDAWKSKYIYFSDSHDGLTLPSKPSKLILYFSPFGMVDSSMHYNSSNYAQFIMSIYAGSTTQVYISAVTDTYFRIYYKGGNIEDTVIYWYAFY